MKPRRRMRATIKWGGAVVTVLLLIVWVGSRWYSGGAFLQASVYHGVVGIHLRVPSWPPKFVWYVMENGVDVQDWPFQLWFEYYEVGMKGFTWTVVEIPIWFIALLTAAPTFLIWRHDRKRPPGTCPMCGYSRTGLPADRACPECGSAA